MTINLKHLKINFTIVWPAVAILAVVLAAFNVHAIAAIVVALLFSFLFTLKIK